MISAAHADTRQMMHVLLDLRGYEVIQARGDGDTISRAEAERPQLVRVDTTSCFDEDTK